METAAVIGLADLAEQVVGLVGKQLRCGDDVFVLYTGHAGVNAGAKSRETKDSRKVLFTKH